MAIIKGRRQLAACVSVIALASVSTPAVAQDAAGNGAQQSEASEGEIIVTAQRREESLQRTALAVAAIGADDLAEAGVSDVTGLTKLVPSLIVQPATGTSVGFYLRGIGALVGNAFTENPVAFNFNQIYVARPAALLGTFYDLERVEVLKGPQGTLYGRNATGGAINVIPKRPQLGERGAEINFEGGSYNAVRAQAAVNLPLGDTAALRVAGQVARRDGYLSDGYDDEQGEALRGSLRFESGIFAATIVGDYFHQGGMGVGSVLVPSPLVPTAPAVDRRIGASDPRSTGPLYAGILASALPPPAKTDGPLPGIIRPKGDGFVDSEFWGISANMDVDLGFATLSFIPAYRDSRPNYLNYNGGYYGHVREQAQQTSIEARLASNGDGPLQYVIGGYYFDEDQTAFNHFVQGNVLSTKFAVDLTSRSRAVFGQATYEIFPDFRLLGGLRYSHEKKTNRAALTQTGVFAGNPVDPFNNNVAPVIVTGANTFDDVTWKAGFEWQATPENLIYANVATGFKSGGFFIATLDNTFDPESITAYTFGSKNRFFDRRLTFNIEAFYWKYQDQQVNYIGPTRNQNAMGQTVVGAGLVTTNAGSSRIYGAEAELSFRVVAKGVFAANVQYLNGKYTELTYLAAGNSPPRTACGVAPVVDPNFPVTPPTQTYRVNCSGRPQINSPEWSLNLSYEQGFDVGDDSEITLGARTKIESSRFLSPEYLPEQQQGAYMMSDLWITYRKDDWSITGFVNNVEDETVYAGTSLRPVFPAVFNILRAPRTWGVRGSFKF
ncbi:TonB-dependent receptor [Sphingomonas sp. LT1P40]|uniref:TonB-dependent receptor n=1 Tax=Alteristakelama amylovorans TaxID=3096166 RepID=UPI002FC77AE2